MPRFSLPAKTAHPFPLALATLTLAATLAPVPTYAAAPTGNWLQLSTTTGDSHASSTRGTLLQCPPTSQGHHPRAAEACAQLTAADGRIRRIGEVPPQDIPCDLDYTHVTAQALGQWNGHPVRYRETFANQCEMYARTGAVFALDNQAPRTPGHQGAALGA
ncbi:SSI family serine proteinase inhibitor [Streptomyces sp. NPDC051597]|uniref:SSI family serine proteinase inhibitor n=1 Tax=Streptomyces sp. NPDC051597 TaxID=3155049 RepID=UPI0034200795